MQRGYPICTMREVDVRVDTLGIVFEVGNALYCNHPSGSISVVTKIGIRDHVESFEFDHFVYWYRYMQREIE